MHHVWRLLDFASQWWFAALNLACFTGLVWAFFSGPVESPGEDKIEPRVFKLDHRRK